MENMREITCKVDPSFISCDECIHCNDSLEICKIRGCVHAVILKECFERKSTEEEVGLVLCSKRNPEKREEVYLVQTDTGYITQCRWTNRGMLFGEEGLEWRWNFLDIPQYQKVVAWMKLPKRVEG